MGKGDITQWVLQAYLAEREVMSSGRRTCLCGYPLAVAEAVAYQDRMILRMSNCLLLAIGLSFGFAMLGSAARAQSYGTQNCTDAQHAILRPAILEAYRLLHTPRTEAQFIRWFGDTRADPALWKQIHDMVGWAEQYAKEVLDVVAPVTGPRRLVKFDCQGGRNSILAHVTGPDTGVIYIDNPFWGLPDRPSLQHVSKASVLLHELSHLAGTVDFDAAAFGYGTNYFRFAADLARVFPQHAVWNAGNYEYYWSLQ